MNGRLLLIRHGEPVGHEGRCIGHHDTELALPGAESIRALGATTADPPRLVVSSDLRRCAGSAGILATAWRAELRFDPRVRELSFGDWEGRRWDDIQTSDAEVLAAWGNDWTRMSAPGGETGIALAERAKRVLTDVRALVAQAPHGVAIVSHAGWIRVATTVLLGEPLSSAFDRSIGYGRAAIFTIRDLGATLDDWNVDRLGAPVSGAGAPRPERTSVPL